MMVRLCKNGAFIAQSHYHRLNAACLHSSCQGERQVHTQEVGNIFQAVSFLQKNSTQQPDKSFCKLQGPVSETNPKVRQALMSAVHIPGKGCCSDQQINTSEVFVARPNFIFSY